MTLRNPVRGALCGALGAAVLWCALGAAAAQGTTPLEQAQALMKQGRYADALPLLEHAVAANAADFEPLILRAEAYRRLSRMDEALRDYVHLSIIKPQDADVWFWVGTIDRWQGRHTEAIAAYERTLALVPCSVDALTGRARSRDALGDHAAAEKDARAAMACDPNAQEPRIYLAESLAKNGRLAEAEALLAQQPAGPARDRQTAAAYDAAGQHCRAAEQYRALAEEEKTADLLLLLGHAERECGHAEKALEAYELSAAADPASIEAQYWWGVMATRLGRNDEAMSAFDTILAKHPSNTAAMVGKARVLRAQGYPLEAMTLVEQVLSLEPENTEAQVLRGQLLAGQGKVDSAREAYEAVLAARPEDADALASFAALEPDAFWSVGAFTDRAEVVEGIDEAGLCIDHEIIVPTRVAYIIDGGRFDFRVPTSERSHFVIGVGDRREAVRDLDTETWIYDYNVLSGSFGFDHRLNDPWTFRWRAGASRYTPREKSSVETDVEALALLSLERAGERSLFRVTALREPFIWRGFASNRQFRIFTHDQLLAEYQWRFDGGWRFESAAAANHYDDGNAPTYVMAGFGWEQGDRSLFLHAYHNPFPARFLDEFNELDFVDYDEVVLSGKTPLLWGFRVYGAATLGRFEDGHELVEVLKDCDQDGTLNRCLVNGPFDTNGRQAFGATLAWSPPTWHPLTLAVEYVYDRYDFDSESYNTNDLHGLWAIAEVVHEPEGARFGWAARYAHGFLGDERDGDYGADDLSGRFSWRLTDRGRRAGPVRLAFEGYGRVNTLLDDQYDESWRYLRLYLIVPF